MTTLAPTDQLTTWTREVALNTDMLRLTKMIRVLQTQLDAVVKEHARLSGETRYLAFEVRAGQVVIDPYALKQLPAPPVPTRAKNAHVEPQPVAVKFIHVDTSPKDVTHRIVPVPEVYINGVPVQMGIGDHLMMLTAFEPMKG